MKPLLPTLLITLTFITVTHAGPDTDGSVICTDGWKDSSIQYSEIKDVCGAIYAELLFNDVAKSTQYYDSIKYVKDNGIVEGYPDDETFGPSEKSKKVL